MKTKRTEAPENTIPRDNKGHVILPITVAQAAQLWNLSVSRVKILVAQGRVLHQRFGVPGHRTRSILILQSERPGRAARGELTDAQRSAADRLNGIR